MRRLSPVVLGVTLAAAVAGGAEAQYGYDPATDPNLRWYQQNIAPMMRDAYRGFQEGMRGWEQSLTPQQQRSYRDCLSQGIDAGNCQFLAQQNQFMAKGMQEQAQIQELGGLCYSNGDQEACQRLEELMASIQARGNWADLMGQNFQFQGRVSQGVRRSQQQIRDRETASQYRMNGWRYENAARQAEAGGDRDTARQMRYRAEQEYAKAREYQPR